MMDLETLKKKMLTSMSEQEFNQALGRLMKDGVVIYTPYKNLIPKAGM